jgi:hypothetical protein
VIGHQPISEHRLLQAADQVHEAVVPQPLHGIGSSADAGQYDPVGAPDHIYVCGQARVVAEPLQCEQQ